MTDFYLSYFLKCIYSFSLTNTTCIAEIHAHSYNGGVEFRWIPLYIYAFQFLSTYQYTLGKVSVRYIFFVVASDYMRFYDTVKCKTVHYWSRLFEKQKLFGIVWVFSWGWNPLWTTVPQKLELSCSRKCILFLRAVSGKEINMVTRWWIVCNFVWNSLNFNWRYFFLCFLYVICWSLWVIWDFYCRISSIFFNVFKLFL